MPDHSFCEGARVVVNDHDGIPAFVLRPICECSEIEHDTSKPSMEDVPPQLRPMIARVLGAVHRPMWRVHAEIVRVDWSRARLRDGHVLWDVDPVRVVLTGATIEYARITRRQLWLGGTFEALLPLERWIDATAQLDRKVEL